MTSSEFISNHQSDVDHLDLTLILDKPAYFPGETLSGVLKVFCRSDTIESIQSIQVIIQGREIATRQRQRTEEDRSELHSDNVLNDALQKLSDADTISNTFVHLEQVITVWKNDTDAPLKKGEHSYPFKLPLPPYLAPSFYVDNRSGQNPTNADNGVVSAMMLYTVTSKLNFVLSYTESTLARIRQRKEQAGTGATPDELPSAGKRHHPHNSSQTAVPFIVIALCPEDQHEESRSIPTVHYLSDSNSGDSAGGGGADGEAKAVENKGGFCCGGGGGKASHTSNGSGNTITGGNSRGDSKEDVKLLLFPYIILFEEELLEQLGSYERYNTNYSEDPLGGGGSPSKSNENDRSVQSLHNSGNANLSVDGGRARKDDGESAGGGSNENQNTHPLENPLLLPPEVHNSNIRMIIKNNFHNSKMILSKVMFRLKQVVEMEVPQSVPPHNRSTPVNVDRYPTTKVEIEKIIIEKKFEPQGAVLGGRSVTFDVQNLFQSFNRDPASKKDNLLWNQLRYYPTPLLAQLDPSTKGNSQSKKAALMKKEEKKLIPTLQTKYVNSKVNLEIELFFYDEKKKREYMKFLQKKNVLCIATSTDYFVFSEQKQGSGGGANNNNNNKRAEDYVPVVRRVPAQYVDVYMYPEK